MKLPLSLVRATLAGMAAVLLASAAYARNDQFLLPYADAMKKSRAKEVAGGLPLRFGGATATNMDIVRPNVLVEGIGSNSGADPRQHHVGHYTDEEICIFAFEDALDKLVKAAREVSAGSVVGIVSDYKGALIDDARTFECHAGTARSFVWLRAQVARTVAVAAPAVVLPPATGFASLTDADAVPLSEAGKDRYRHFLTLPTPRAFVVMEDGHWYMTWKDPEAMSKALNYCARVGKRCWLYAADDHVVWDADVAKRIGTSAQLKGGDGE